MNKLETQFKKAVIQLDKVDAIFPYEKASMLAKIRDKRCMGCNHDGSEYRLETHHRNKQSYGKNGRYAPCKPSDLTTFCEKCHDLHTNMDRKNRYLKRELLNIAVNESLPPLSKLKEKAEIKVFDSERNTPRLSLIKNTV